MGSWPGLSRDFEQLLEAELNPGKMAGYPVWEAARYSLLGGGKRVRPRLLVAACELAASPPRAALPFAAALEMIHTYSLIHDDLPAMDDDDFRRGQASCHKAFGEATAILAGDLLLNRACELMIRVCLENPEGPCLKAMGILMEASGGVGMILGQDRDLALERSPEKEVELADVLWMAELKTSRLIRAALLMGGWLADLDQEVLDLLGTMGTSLGLAFQIKDDILDCVSSRDTLGKTPLKDQGAGKKTFVTLAGLESARTLLDEKENQVLRILDQLEAKGLKTGPLAGLVAYLTERNY